MRLRIDGANELEIGEEESVLECLPLTSRELGEESSVVFPTLVTPLETVTCIAVVEAAMELCLLEVEAVLKLTKSEEGEAEVL